MQCQQKNGEIGFFSPDFSHITTHLSKISTNLNSLTATQRLTRARCATVRITSAFETPCRRPFLHVACTLPHAIRDSSSVHTRSLKIPTISQRDQWPSPGPPAPQKLQSVFHPVRSTIPSPIGPLPAFETSFYIFRSETTPASLVPQKSLPVPSDRQPQAQFLCAPCDCRHNRWFDFPLWPTP